jgi:hypothetical protein
LILEKNSRSARPSVSYNIYKVRKDVRNMTEVAEKWPRNFNLSLMLKRIIWKYNLLFFPFKAWGLVLINLNWECCMSSIQ